jgi:hypothetical protein
MEGYKINPGAVRISRVDLVMVRPDVRIWHIDMHTKYAEVCGYSLDEDFGTLDIYLHAGMHALHPDESVDRDMPTTVRLSLPQRAAQGTWNVIADKHARYEARVVAYWQEFSDDVDT